MTFITQTDLQRMAKFAAIFLTGNLVMANLIRRRVQTSNMNNSGGKCKVTWMPIGTPTTQDHRISGNRAALTATSDSEQSQEISLEHYIGERRAVDTYEGTFELNSFQDQIIAPMAAGIAKEVDKFLLNRVCGGMVKNVSNNPTAQVATIADILAGRKKYLDNNGPDDVLNFVFGTEVESNLLQLTEYASADYSENARQAVERAKLVRKFNLDHYMSQHAGQDFDEGTTTGTPLVNGGSQTGTSLVVDGFSASSRYLNRGARFTVNGETHTLSQDVLIDGSGNATLTLNDALAAPPADNDAITFAPHKQNVIFHPDSVAGAILAPPALMGAKSAVETHRNLSVRLTVDGGLDGSTGAGDDIQMDVYVGCEVVRPELGVIVGS